MRLTSLISAILLTVVLAACGKRPSVTSASLDSCGTYAQKTVGRVKNAASSSGYVNYADALSLIKSTDVIAAKPGVTFGIGYTPFGAPSRASIKTVVRLQHPPISNPETGRVLTFEEDPHTDFVGVPTFSLFTFEKEWEIVPGKWTYQVYYGSHVILEKSFTVIDGRKGG